MKHLFSNAILFLVVLVLFSNPIQSFAETENSVDALQSAKEFIARGIEYIQKGQYDNAIESLNKAILLNPEEATAYNIRGIAFNFNGQI